MRLSKRQSKFLSLVEACGYLLRNEINEAQYPKTLISALIKKELIHEINEEIHLGKA